MADKFDYAAARAIQSGALTDAPDAEDPASWRAVQRVRWVRVRQEDDWLYAAAWWCHERWGWVGHAVLHASGDTHHAESATRFRSQAEAAGDALRRLQHATATDVLNWLPA